MFTFPGLMMTSTSEESKALNMDMTPKVIISASGMCDAGRASGTTSSTTWWRSECTICFVGYQAQGSLGARLLDGVDKVRLFGEEIAVHARIVKFEGMVLLTRICRTSWNGSARLHQDRSMCL